MSSIYNLVKIVLVFDYISLFFDISIHFLVRFEDSNIRGRIRISPKNAKKPSATTPTQAWWSDCLPKNILNRDEQTPNKIAGNVVGTYLSSTCHSTGKCNFHGMTWRIETTISVYIIRRRFMHIQKRVYVCVSGNEMKRRRSVWDREGIPGMTIWWELRRCWRLLGSRCVFADAAGMDMFMIMFSSLGNGLRMSKNLGYILKIFIEK